MDLTGVPFFDFRHNQSSAICTLSLSVLISGIPFQNILSTHSNIVLSWHTPKLAVNGFARSED